MEGEWEGSFSCLTRQKSLLKKRQGIQILFPQKHASPYQCPTAAVPRNYYVPYIFLAHLVHTLSNNGRTCTMIIPSISTITFLEYPSFIGAHVFLLCPVSGYVFVSVSLSMLLSLKELRLSARQQLTCDH